MGRRVSFSPHSRGWSYTYNGDHGESTQKLPTAFVPSEWFTKRIRPTIISTPTNLLHLLLVKQNYSSLSQRRPQRMGISMWEVHSWLSERLAALTELLGWADHLASEHAKPRGWLAIKLSHWTRVLFSVIALFSYANPNRENEAQDTKLKNYI